MNTYKEPFIAPDSRIHANYRQVGARTGRMSCADPNMQNQPRDDLRLRYNIVADPGYKLVTCDLTNIEMVLFAAYCGEGRLLTPSRTATTCTR
jgi:DNA polymerase-1